MSWCSVSVLYFKKHATLQTFYPVCYLKNTYIVTIAFKMTVQKRTWEENYKFIFHIISYMIIFLFDEINGNLFFLEEAEPCNRPKLAESIRIII